MRAVTSAALLGVLLGVCLPAAADEITAETGQTVTLSCRATQRTNIIVVQWSRADLETEGYVLLNRNNRPDSAQQLPSFRGRVELKEGWKEDGDVSLILKNVTTEDSGTYECRVVQEGTTRRKRGVLLENEPIKTVSLSVVQGHTEAHSGGGEEDRSSGGHVGLIVGAIASVGLILAVGLVIFKRCQMKSSLHSSPESSAPVSF
ncbi:butyrophilin-like protein 2 [Parambassis ranga]|uniref:Butyrophilin-like protein 2 n=1 Tax=Parambassis ranga TaxID=210632 RepID=A0A6P7IDG5_9TELE|nr:butyrophilin-like protein 2 [Parambassis ranga]XP_028262722.1 butyrophilin-like protein 2 [Parambassis ranga]